jgi:hypothetical protein
MKVLRAGRAFVYLVEDLRGMQAPVSTEMNKTYHRVEE